MAEICTSGEDLFVLSHEVVVEQVGLHCASMPVANEEAKRVVADIIITIVICINAQHQSDSPAPRDHESADSECFQAGASGSERWPAASNIILLSIQSNRHALSAGSNQQ